MSEAISSKIEEDEPNPTDSLAEEGSTGQVRVLKKGKGKKKGKAKKRRESVESKDEEGHDDEDSSSRKKKGKKKAAIQPEVDATSESKQLEAAVTVDETPKETVIEIQGEEKKPEELKEIVVNKESTLIEGDNVIQEKGVSAEGGGEEKQDLEQEKIGEEGTKEAVSEVEGATVRRRATLSDIRSESVDKGDGEQAVSTTVGSEELEAVKEEGSVEQKHDTSRDKQSTEDEKDKDTKEDTKTIGDDGTAPEGKQLEEKLDKGQEKPDVVTIEMTGSVEHVAVPLEEEAKTENVEGGEGEVKTESTELRLPREGRVNLSLKEYCH